MQLRQGVFGQLRIVSNWSIDPLDLERDVTNVIPLRPNSERLNPTQMIDRLHSLCEELQHVKSEALHLDKLLHLGPDSTNARPEQSSSSDSIDAVVEAVAELIVETTAELIAPPSPAKT